MKKRGITIRGLFLILMTFIGALILFYEAIYAHQSYSIKLSKLDIKTYLYMNLKNLITNPSCLSYIDISLSSYNNNISIYYEPLEFILDIKKIENMYTNPLLFRSCLVLPYYNLTIDSRTIPVDFFNTNLPIFSTDKLGFTIVDLETGKLYEFNNNVKCLDSSISLTGIVIGPVFIKLKYVEEEHLGVAYICLKL